MISAQALAGQVTLAWDAVANATGYKVHYGQSSANYAPAIDAKNQLTYTVPALTDGARYYFAVTAYGAAGTTESGYSNEVSTVVSGVAPVASFTANPTSGAAPLTVTLTDTSAGNVTSRSWNLGDGTTAATATVVKTYSALGTYLISLTVAGGGGSTTATQSINVSAAAPVANFSATPLSGNAPLTVSFTDSSSGATSWSWKFGDGGTSTAQNPSYSYTKAGTYTVMLDATGPGGSNQTTKTGYITVSGAPGGSGDIGGTPANTAGLVAAYGFEETGGNQVIDASGNANHGAISGASRISTKQFGKAVKFNGTSNWITVNHSASLDLSNALTVEAWVYPTAMPSGWSTILLKEQTGGLTYALYANSDGNRPNQTISVGGSDKQLSVGSRLTVNTWTHLAATYDGVTQKLYVNGSLAGSRPQAGRIAVSDGKLRIGGNSVWGEYFTGRIDEVRVYNRPLTQAEIAADSKLAVVGLLVSTKPDRSGSVPLNGLTVSGNIYISYKLISPTTASNPVKHVKFWLDDPTPTNPTGAPRLVELSSPFDLSGTLSDGTAAALNTTELAKGVHTVTAQVTLSDGTVLPFTIGTLAIQ